MVKPLRRHVPWSRVLGVVLVALALLLVTDADWPVPRDPTPEGSAGDPGSLLPEPLAPRGRLGRIPAEFAWRWQGPPVAWRLVVLDADLREVFTGRARRRARFATPPELEVLLRRGGEFQWYVAGELDGREVRSVPELIRVGGR